MADKFADHSDPNIIKRSMHPAQARREAIRMASETLEAAGLGKLTEENIRPRQPHSNPVGASPPDTERSASSAFRKPTKKEISVPDSARAQPIVEMEDYGRRSSDISSTGGLAAVATGSAVASVGAMAFLGGTLLPALLITSAITGVFVAYQYFSKSGLFKEPEPMLPDQRSMLVRGATPGQEMQAMIGSEEARLAAERAQMGGMGQTVTMVSPEIEVPQTPSVAKADQRQGMQPPQGGSKGLS